MPNESKYKEYFFAQFGYHLNRTGNILAAILEDRLADFGITLPVWRVVWCVDTFGEMSLSELASHSGFEMSWLTRIVSAAQAKNFVVKSRDKKKKSVVRVALTPEGRGLIGDILPIIRSIGSESLSGVPEADVETTTRTLGLIYENVIKIAESSGSINKKLIIARRVGNILKTKK